MPRKSKTTIPKPKPPTPSTRRDIRDICARTKKTFVDSMALHASLCKCDDTQAHQKARTRFETDAVNNARGIIELVLGEEALEYYVATSEAAFKQSLTHI